MNCEFATQAADKLASHASDLQQVAGYDRTVSAYLEDFVRCAGLTAGCAAAKSVASQYREMERVAEQIVAGPAGYSGNADAFAASSQDVALAAATARSVMGDPATFAAIQRQGVNAIADLNASGLRAASVFQREYEKFSRRTSFATVLAALNETAHSQALAAAQVLQAPQTQWFADTAGLTAARDFADRWKFDAAVSIQPSFATVLVALNETAHSQAVAAAQDFYAPQKQWFLETAGVTAARDFADRWKLDTAASLQPAANFAAYAGLTAQATVADISALGLIQTAREAAAYLRWPLHQQTRRGVSARAQVKVTKSDPLLPTSRIARSETSTSSESETACPVGTFRLLVDSWMLRQQLQCLAERVKPGRRAPATLPHALAGTNPWSEERGLVIDLARQHPQHEKELFAAESQVADAHDLLHAPRGLTVSGGHESLSADDVALALRAFDRFREILDEIERQST